ncbi:hypothetical protein WA026_007929 [Henosepilachna vigintioctopunctata]|uniref:Ig-like domain-containing protein n=1 Tax=Henosepilachna vigintioctopunctata TaxID=420089 RepID=A0AAW1TRG7_9CUCU
MMAVMSENQRMKILQVITNLVFLMVLGCSALRLTNMTSPTVQDPRDDMQFYCEYDMGGEELYAVKWYKDDHEFFRYIPTGDPSSVEFQVMGVHVDSRKTHCDISSCRLFLNNLSRTFSSGAYRCEVSSEAPAFRLASETHNVTVAVLPKENPRIDGLRGSYVSGEYLNVTCTSGFGDPKPILLWYINHRPVQIKYIKELESIQEEGGIKLHRISLQLHFPLVRQMTEKKDISTIEVACFQTVEDINPAITASRVTKREILIASENITLKNQKLYGFLGNSVSELRGNFMLFSTFCVMYTMKFCCMN